MNFEKEFLSSSRPHILMITNHGIHQWQIIPGLPDTGGQNVFVNQFTHQLAHDGFKITIINRGGYPHPVSGVYRRGYDYKDENQRILYLEDDISAFVPKEEMDAHIPDLCVDLIKHLTAEDLDVDLIISHYWDGAKLGLAYNLARKSPVKHIWIPHSLGAIKKRNLDPEQWKKLRIDERIKNEEMIIARVDAIASTSAIISGSLKQDYHYSQTPMFLPPCVDPARYYPHAVTQNDPVWTFLCQHSGLTKGEIQQSLTITEISRTDQTKRKAVLIKAFAKVREKFPNALLIISIEQTNQPLGSELIELIRKLRIEKSVAVLGSVWDQLPDIYAVTSIYCTPSIMEGFGMSAQEAAATAVPVVASNLVPFVTEYLVGEDFEEVPYGSDGHTLKIGKGAVVAPGDDVEGFTQALLMLLEDSGKRRRLGDHAYQLTIPYFTWEHMVRNFLDELDLGGKNEEKHR